MVTNLYSRCLISRSLRLLCLVGTIAGNALAANAVVEWNAIASQAIATATAAGRPGPATTLDFAVVHIAIHDAVQAIEKEFQPYETRTSGNGSTAAATAKAARDVLVGLFPTQTESLDTAYNNYLTTNRISTTDPGVAVGQRAAAGILARRANDGSYPTGRPPFNGSMEPGAWRPTPSYLPGAPAGFAPMAIPWLSEVTPFAIRSPSQFRPAPPPGLNSQRYARDYQEVKAMGSLNGSSRTAEQTGLAYFWSDNFPVQWNRTIRAIVDTHLTNEVGASARLFALANMASADAAITAWDSKYHFNFWRPVTAIQEGEQDGNTRTQGDPNWQPLLNTPNYPDFTSGANNLTGAITRILTLFFGTDRLTFTVTSNVALASPNTRTYNRFSDAADDVVDARIYEGIHFRFADAAARRQGTQVANWVFRHYLRPVE